MSVSVGPTWRKTPGQWLVTIAFKWTQGGALFRKRFTVGKGTTFPMRTENQAREFGEREERKLFAAGPESAEQEKVAKAEEKAVAAQAKDDHAVANGETVSTWWSAYHDLCATGEVGRKNKGRPQASIDARRSNFKNWVEPELGHLVMVAVTAKNLRKLVEVLDAAVRLRARFYSGEVTKRNEKTGRKPGLSSKSAKNIWGEVVSGFKEAQRSKKNSLRVLEGRPNPVLDVEGPTAGDDDDREQEALYPSEVVKLLSCEEVPLFRRRVYAVALYTGLRLSELRRMRATDVDFEHELLTVRGSKSDAAKRKVQIDPALKPLLKVLTKERPTGALLDCPRADGRGGAADITRDDLERAGVTRAALLRDDADYMPYNFHGHRHTCVTHWAVGGKSELFMLLNAGHTDVAMTKRYVAAASSLSAKFGQAHPPLPAPVLGGAKVIRLADRTA